MTHDPSIFHESDITAAIAYANVHGRATVLRDDDTVQMVINILTKPLATMDDSDRYRAALETIAALDCEHNAVDDEQRKRGEWCDGPCGISPVPRSKESHDPLRHALDVERAEKAEAIARDLAAVDNDGIVDYEADYSDVTPGNGQINGCIFCKSQRMGTSDTWICEPACVHRRAVEATKP